MKKTLMWLAALGCLNVGIALIPTNLNARMLPCPNEEPWPEYCGCMCTSGGEECWCADIIIGEGCDACKEN